MTHFARLVRSAAPRAGKPALLLALLALALPGAAMAAFPGANGKLVVVGDETPDDSTPDELYLMNPDGSGRTRLTDNAFTEMAPTFSADGRRIAFARSSGSTFDIFVMSVDGGAPLNVTQSSATNEGSPTWSPDGARLAYARRSGIEGDIVVRNADGSGGETELTSGPADDRDPAWSPDGTRIAFIRNSRLWIMDATGANPTQLSPLDISFTPTWSPSGGRIAWASYTGLNSNAEIYDILPSGADVRNLTNGGGDDLTPAYSPDGTRIAYSGDCADAFNAVCQMNTEGGAKARISEFGFDPDWQPVEPAGPAEPTTTPPTVVTPAPTRACVVPKLKGKTLKAARKALRRAGCAAGKVTKRYSRKVRRGRVMAHRPAVRSRRPAGSKVSLVVSKGPRRR